MTFKSRVIPLALAVSIFGGVRAGLAQMVGGTGLLVTSAPVFVLPDATRTPLATLPQGTSVRVIAREGEWFRVEFHDVNFGDRTGYVAAESIQVQIVQPPSDQEATGLPRPQAPSRTAPPQNRRGGSLVPRQRVAISVNAGLQTTSRDFASVSTFQRFLETATITSAYTGDRPLVLDMAGSVEMWRGLGAGVGVTRTSKPLADAVSAEIPHPLFFDRPRTVTGVASEIAREETVVHLDAVWVSPSSTATRLAVFAGPSYFKVTQGLVTDVLVTDAYPYDTATFASATTVDATESKWGFNAGFDLTRSFSRNVGVGVIGRYSRALFAFPIASTDAAQNVDVTAGGFQIGGGLRLMF